MPDKFFFDDDDDDDDHPSIPHDDHDDDDHPSIPRHGFETGSAVDHDNLKYKIDTVTVVTGIDKRINLSHLSDAAPEVFGVRSQGIRLLTVYGQFLFDSQQVSSPRLLR